MAGLVVKRSLLCPLVEHYETQLGKKSITRTASEVIEIWDKKVVNSIKKFGEWWKITSSDDDMARFERFLESSKFPGGVFATFGKYQLMSTNFKSIWTELNVFYYDTFKWLAILLKNVFLSWLTSFCSDRGAKIKTFVIAFVFTESSTSSLTCPNNKPKHTKRPSFLPFYGQRGMKCFEALFTDQLKPDWIFNKTNDGEWEGKRHWKSFNLEVAFRTLFFLFMAQ